MLKGLKVMRPVGSKPTEPSTVALYFREVATGLQWCSHQGTVNQTAWTHFQPIRWRYCLL